MRIQFGSYRLDDQRFILERDGLRVSVRPKVFDLLAYLSRDRDRVVPREELVEALWGGAVVGMGSLSGLVNELRKLLREDGRGPSSIRTVHARGYQFVAQIDSVEEEAPHALSRAPASLAPPSTPALTPPPTLPGTLPPTPSLTPPGVFEGDGHCPIPEVLPAPIERALWLHLREDLERIEKFSAWLDQLRSEATAPGRARMQWKHALEGNAGPVRAMRTVEPSTAKAQASSSAGPAQAGKSGRSA